jgi:hypothetical protein
MIDEEGPFAERKARRASTKVAAGETRGTGSESYGNPNGVEYVLVGSQQYSIIKDSC